MSKPKDERTPLDAGRVDPQVRRASLERRLYTAWRRNKGMRLSQRDVFELLGDDALQTRICNAIAEEEGFENPGIADSALWGVAGSIAKFVERWK